MRRFFAITMHHAYVRAHRYCRRCVRRIVALRLRRNRGRQFPAQLLFSSLCFIFFVHAFKHAVGLVSTELNKFSHARSILIISVLDESAVLTVTTTDPRGTLEDLSVPKKWAGGFIRMRHVISFSDSTAHERFMSWFSRHLRWVSHVHVDYVPALPSHAAKVHYAVSIHRDFRFVMLWDFVQMKVPLSDFRLLARFAKSQKPFIVHEEFTYNSSKSNVRAVFERHGYVDLLKDSSRPWRVTMMRLSLFESVGGLFNFSFAGYACLGIRAHFEGANLWRARIGVPKASAPVATRGEHSLMTHVKANVMESCGIPDHDTEKLMPAYVIRSARRKVALVHEMIPLPNQGGNIRLIEILDVLLANGFHLEIFVRENIEADVVISIKDKHSVRVWADDFKLTRFRASALDFDCVISAMWFWNRPKDTRNEVSVTIPIIVEQLIGDNLHISHVVVTDDIHASRCFQTETKNREYCSSVRQQEESVWRSFRIMKIFVSTEDMAYARSVAPEATETMTFIPYIIVPKHPGHPLTPWRIQTSFKLAYFGKAHPANVGALKTLLRAYRARENRVLHKVTELWIVGDEKWIKVKEVRDAVRPSRETRVRVVGELKDLDAFVESVDLVLAPVTVGGTGVSSKLFKCLELNVPFVSTSLGMRGFDCDAECRSTFFANKVEDVLTLGVKLLFDAEHRVMARLKMREMAQKLTSRNIGDNALFMRALSMRNEVQISSRTQSPRNVYGGSASGTKCSDDFECTVCGFTENCVRVCDLERRHVKNEPILLSVYTSLLGGTKEVPFMKHFVLDVLNQNFDIGAWEVVVASSDANVLTKFRDWIVRGRTCDETTLHRVRTVHLRSDAGLYETWDELITNFTSGEVLTNWNADDRKHSRALATKVSVLRRLPTIDVVSSAVYASSLANQDWSSCQRATQRPAAGKRCEVWFSERGEYALSSFVQSDPTTAILTTSPQNYPHNAPVYRRRVHDKVGYFSSDKAAIAALGEEHAPTCFDWRFWVRVASEGGKFYNVDAPLEVYYVRLDSHGRRDEPSSDACIRSVFQPLYYRGLYNNAFYWRFNFAEQFKWHRKFIFFIDRREAGALDAKVESDFLKWLDENGHRVDVLDISRIQSTSHVDHLYETSSTARVRPDSRALTAASEVDLVFLGPTVQSQRKRNKISRGTLKHILKRLNAPTALISASRSSHHLCAELYRCEVIDVSNRSSKVLLRTRIISVGNTREFWASSELIKYLHQNDK